MPDQPLPDPLASRTNTELREEAIRRMLDTAIGMIAERGAARLSLVDVGRKAGYSHSLPNYYFKSKTGLLAAVYEQTLKRARVSISSWAKAHSPERVRPGLSNILATTRAYLSLTSADSTTALALHAIISESVTAMPDLLESVRPQNRLLLEFFEQELRNGIKRGEIDPGVDVTSVALMIAALLRGSVAQYRIDPAHTDLERLSATVCQVLMRAITPPP